MRETSRRYLDDDRLDSAINGSLAEAYLEGTRGDVGRFTESSGTARLDFVAKRRAFAVGHRHMPWTGRVASVRDGAEPRRRGKSSISEVARNRGRIAVSVRRAREEFRRVVSVERRERTRHGVREFVVGDAIP